MSVVVKSDGSEQKFDPSKVRKWVSWAVGATKDLKDAIEAEYYILQETLKRLPEKVKTSELHQTMINVCLDKEEIEYSRIASVLEKATLYKNLERSGFVFPQGAEFEDLADFFFMKNIWIDLLADATDEEVKMVNETYIELEAVDLEFWVVKQWKEKYSQKINDLEAETPAMGALGIAIGFHGVTELAMNLARDIVNYKVNLPTPVLNGVRNGNTDTISCCVIEANDEVTSLNIADFLAAEMTAKKAGIGITLNTRSQGDNVKNGQVKHLGKAPLYMSLEKAVKKFTQISRGGSASMTFKAIDPDVMKMLLWKTQRIDVAQRIDKIDYEFTYNEAFVDAVIHGRDWYLFSLHDAPEVHEAFSSPDYMDVVRDAIARGVKHKKVKAIEVVKELVKSRWEHGRLYVHNVSRSNEHTPFLDEITQSNLCMEIMLPTKPWKDLPDLMSDNPQGEMAFCAIAAINVAFVGLEEYFAVADRLLRTVDRMIDLAKGLTPTIERHLKERRSVGIGITGLAAYLYKQGLDYDGSKESLREVEQLGMLHYYSLLKSSQEQAKESGIHAKGIDTNWMPCDTAKFVCDDWDYDFEPDQFRGKPRKHSVLVAHMPCESSSAFSNSTNGLYPTRQRVIYKKARTGKIQFIVPEFTDDKLRVWDIDMVHYYQAIGNSADQAISADYYCDFTKYENKKMPDIEGIRWFIRQAKAGIKTAYYQNFKDVEHDEGDCSTCKL